MVRRTLSPEKKILRYHSIGETYVPTSCLQWLTAQILLDLSVDAVPREVPTVGHCARVAATWGTLWPRWALRTRGTLQASKPRT